MLRKLVRRKHHIAIEGINWNASYCNRGCAGGRAKKRQDRADVSTRTICQNDTFNFTTANANAYTRKRRPCARLSGRLKCDAGIHRRKRVCGQSHARNVRVRQKGLRGPARPAPAPKRRPPLRRKRQPHHSKRACVHSKAASVCEAFGSFEM